MSKSRESQIAKMNRMHDNLDNLPADVVAACANGCPPPSKYDHTEIIQRLAKEVRYLRLHSKLYGG